MNIIETHELTKRYPVRGGQPRVAVNGLNLNVEQGSVFGLIGPNGAGKTTTMRMLATLLEPSSGDATVAGASITREVPRVRRAIGYMPDFFGVYTDMTCAEYLSFFAACYGVPAGDRDKLTDDLLQLVDLAHRKHDQVDKLSRGMKQRLGLARTLAHDPQVLLLDEPASGLDPRARVEMRELIKELRAMGKTIVLSSHILAELEDVCTHIAIVAEGEIKAMGSLDVVRAQLRPHRTVLVKFLGDPALGLKIAKGCNGVIDAIGSAPEPADGAEPAATTVLREMRVLFDGDYSAASELLRTLMHSGVQVVMFNEEADSLESLFMQVTS